MYLRLEETGLAEQAMRESLALARDIGHARIVPAALCNLGHVLAAAGKAHEARSALLEAQALARVANDQRLFEECQGTLDTLPPETAVEGSPLQFIRD